MPSPEKLARLTLISLAFLFNFAVAAAAQEGLPDDQHLSLPPLEKTDHIVTVRARDLGTPNDAIVSTDPILILDAWVNPDNSLTITGRSLGTRTPIVSLDGEALTVSSRSDREIIAQVRATLMPGVHMLTVSADSDSTEFAAFNLRIGTVEPQTLKGPGPEVLRIAGLGAFNHGHFVQAQILLDRAMALAVQENDIDLAGYIHGDVGGIYLSKFDFLKAERELVQAVDMLRRQPQHAHALAISLANLSVALSGQHRYSEASTALSEASKLIKQNAINDPQLQIRILDVWAGIRLRQGKSKQAEALFLRALKMNSLTDNTAVLTVADIFNNLGILYARNGNYGEAVASCMRALKLTEQQFGPSHPNVTILLENLGFTYIQMGKYAEAEPLFLRSLSILENEGLMVSNVALHTLLGLGRTSMEQHQLERAQALLARAIEVGHELRAHTPEMAETLDVYANVLASLSKNSEAEKLHTEAVRMRAELAWTTRPIKVK
jgi:tetratricopeptide (TPR) repeat protein